MQNNAPMLNRTLTLKHVYMFGLALIAPTTVFALYGIAITNSQGMVPTAYAIAMVVMLVTAYSYGQMVKEYPRAGSAYTYTQKVINPHVGFLIGWTILLDYLFSPMISALLFSIFASSYYPSIPLYVWVLCFVVGITIVNIVGIKFSANLNTLLLLFQVAFIVLFCAFSIKGVMEGKGGGQLFSALPFYDPQVSLPSLLGIVPLLCFSFLGFDAITTLSEETINPTKVLPKAILLVPLTAGFFFIASAYFCQIIFPDFHSFANPEVANIDIFRYAGGELLLNISAAVIAASAFASAVASQSGAARILYAMGRDGILPTKIFGKLSAKFQTPVWNILIVSCLALSALFLDMMTATAFINFGALLAFTFVNLCVIVLYFGKKKKRTPKDGLFYLVIPLIGASFTFGNLLMLDVRSLVLGGTWLTVGFLYLLYLTKMFQKRPPEFIFEENQGSVREMKKSG
ncbi:UNVERIFIED_CONTAM: amino acid transporter [Brevibacillus sp. OAP136]